MMQDSYPSLFDSSAASQTVPDTLDWLTGLMLGSLATGLSVIAVAMVGLMMLSGRLALREGAKVAFGCFVLFGAPAIAVGLRGLANGDDVEHAAALPQAGPVLEPRLELPRSTYDPYAGATVRDD